MNDKMQALEGAKRFATQFQGFMKAVELLGGIGSIEQAGDEAQERLKRLRDLEATECARQADEKNAHNAVIEKLRKDAATMTVLHHADAEEHKAQREKEVEQHKAQCERMVADAKREAEAIIRSGHAEKAELIKSLADKRAELADVEKRHRDLGEEVTNREGRLAHIREQIAQLRG